MGKNMKREMENIHREPSSAFRQSVSSSLKCHSPEGHAHPSPREFCTIRKTLLTSWQV